MKRLLILAILLVPAVAQAEIRVQHGYSGSYYTPPTRVYRYSYTPAYNPYAQGNSGYGYYGYNPYTGQLGQSGYYAPTYQYVPTAPYVPQYQPYRSYWAPRR